jgi:hypothetical protein
MAATSFSFINGSANGDYKADSLVFERPRRREAARGLFNFVGSFANRLLVCIREIE